MINLSLQKEIIKHIFFMFGIDLASSQNFKFGFIKNEMICDISLKIEEDEVICEKSLWAGQLQVADSLIRCMICSLGTDDLNEFALIFKLNNNPLYGIKLSNDNSDNGIFNYQISPGKLVQCAIILQANVLVGVERISELTVFWTKPIDDINPLREEMISFLKSGDF